MQSEGGAAARSRNGPGRYNNRGGTCCPARRGRGRCGGRHIGIGRHPVAPHRRAVQARPGGNRAIVGLSAAPGGQVAERETVVEGKEVAVRVGLGGRGIIKKKKTTK